MLVAVEMPDLNKGIGPEEKLTYLAAALLLFEP
jgi:hypothetical protein